MIRAPSSDLDVRLDLWEIRVQGLGSACVVSFYPSSFEQASQSIDSFRSIASRSCIAIQ